MGIGSGLVRGDEGRVVVGAGGRGSGGEIRPIGAAAAETSADVSFLVGVVGSANAEGDA